MEMRNLCYDASTTNPMEDAALFDFDFDDDEWVRSFEAMATKTDDRGNKKRQRTHSPSSNIADDLNSMEWTPQAIANVLQTIATLSFRFLHVLTIPDMCTAKFWTIWCICVMQIHCSTTPLGEQPSKKSIHVRKIRFFVFARSFLDTLKPPVTLRQIHDDEVMNRASVVETCVSLCVLSIGFCSCVCL